MKRLFIASIAAGLTLTAAQAQALENAGKAQALSVTPAGFSQTESVPIDEIAAPEATFTVRTKRMPGGSRKLITAETRLHDTELVTPHNAPHKTGVHYTKRK